MRRASYRQAIEWIARRKTDLREGPAIRQAELSRFAAFLFGVTTTRIANDILRWRTTNRQ